MKIFKLPDLGEGLMEAEIVQWHVAVGDEMEVDQPLVSVETAKAIVEIPAPYPGRINKLFGNAGDIIATGAPLVEFDDGGKVDGGTVVGTVKVGREVVEEGPSTVGKAAAGIRAIPAVRALARRLEVDLCMVTPSGPDGLITAADVQRVAKILSEVGPMEPLRGVRRAMARNMAQAHAEVVPVTLIEDADIDAWAPGTDVTIRLIRALIAACKAEPALNAWYDGHAMGRRVLKKIDLGIAVDTEEGLFVPVLRDVSRRDVEDLRRGIEALKADVKARKIPPEELRGATFTLSNFGMIAGRHASPIVLPPTVAILGAGRIRSEVVAVDRQGAVHWILPLSLTFDHRAVTGGEAGRFLAAIIKDLESSK
jgi:Pyruvate/2-oxoglutarate dehydrogenase complex, dihydrolipoamide acyltransferase (E2) component, and related enzymes